MADQVDDALAVPMRKVKEIETEVLSRPGRYKPVADNLQVKEVVVGDGERRKRYVTRVMGLRRG
jgi:hypothetical protein